ncbi:hybrid sensor histidine kinase/response regulator transcription factor [Lewinella cohaerens]|uniref:hybrid sensor histidine kinase/response regulator transcription factor n=1 Tax=Lewinella cohaerens TaxID=70995 RepID=UPI0003781FE7|nr:ATP-binding protein [Lewinella cohaerens]
MTVRKVINITFCCMLVLVANAQKANWAFYATKDSLSGSASRKFCGNKGLVSAYYWASFRCLFFLALALLFLSGTANAQPPAHFIQLDRIGEKQGLGSQYSTRIYQDRKGFLWLCSINALQRYDGVELKSYPRTDNDSLGITESYPSYLTEDRSGNLWAITASGKLFRYDEAIDNFRELPLLPKWAHDGVSPLAHCLLEDRWGVYWMGIGRAGLCQLNVETGELTQFSPAQGEEVPLTVNVIEEDAEGNIWTVDSDLFCLMPPSGQKGERHIQRYSIDRADDAWLYALEIGKSGLIWAGGRGDKIYAFNPKTKETKPFQFIAKTEVFENLIRRINRIREDSRGLVWVAVNGGGLVIIDPIIGGRTNLTLKREEPYGFSVNSTNDVLEDNTGQIWLSSWPGGIFRYSPQAAQFGHVRSVPVNPKTLSNPVVNVITETPDGTIWAGTMDGLNRFDPKTKEVQRYKIPHPDKDRQGNEIHALAAIRAADNLPPDLLWVGTEKGLKQFNPQNGQFSDWRSPGPKGKVLEKNYIIEMTRSSDGHLFVRAFPDFNTWLYWDSSRRDFLTVDLPAEFKEVSNIFLDGNATFWAQTNDGNLLKYDWNKEVLQRIEIAEEDKKGVSLQSNLYVLTRAKGKYWILTNQGFFSFVETENPASFRLQRIHLEKWLLPDEVRSMLEDSDGNLWISTAAGLACFRPDVETFDNYSTEDGVQGNEFIDGASFKSPGSGYLYFGGVNGFNFFHPDSIREDTIAPPVAITSIKVLRDNAMERVFPKPKGKDSTPFIEIKHAERVLRIKYAALHFANPQQNQYAYQLEGFDNDWRYVSNEHEVTYTNLDPGTYLFSVKAANKDGLWNEVGAGLTIRILSPWWQTWWAYLAYALLVGGMAFGISYFLKKRWQLQNDLKLKQAEATRLKELDHFKSRLYTNLTHEFRTPLTVILGMTGQIKNNPSKYLEAGSQLIETNGKNLLRLINQLLDLSKLENKSFQLHLQQGDIIPYLRYVTESFQTYINSHNLSLRFFTTLENLEMDFDPEQIKQVMTNLLSNAVKFTPSGGEVRINVLPSDRSGDLHEAEGTFGNALVITVTDTGIGIPDKDLPHIFDRFYQVDGSHTREGKGTGIGLAHTQELVKLMGGKIIVKSQPGKGTAFTMVLPITNNATRVESEQGPEPLPGLFTPSSQYSNGTIPSTKPTNQNAPRLLLIEDNPDVVVYLKSCLEGLYQIDVAYNGKIGIKKALEYIPDLIISDVMMPEKNGYQVCDTLKNDTRTSHIPIVLLTAKADAASRIAGLRRGADAYLSKPFNKDELLIRLEMLMERQRRMAAYFVQKIKDGNVAVPPEPAIEEAIEIEDAFIRKVREVVAENSADENFALPQLCQKIGMSRSQLFRKMKALIAESPSSFIRNHRLNEAKKLLETTEMNVSEVAWKVGYKDPAHFSKSFQEVFGVLPSQVLQDSRPGGFPKER